MSVCTLVRHHVSACEWGGMMAGTLVYSRQVRFFLPVAVYMAPDCRSRAVLGPKKSDFCVRRLLWRFSAAVS